LPLICFFLLAVNQGKIIAKFSNNSKNLKYENISKNNIENKYSNYKIHIQNEINTFIDFLALGVESENLKSEDKVTGIEIISDMKSTSIDEIIAKGNVVASTNSAVLKADELQYNSKTNFLFIKGNIEFKIEDQFLLASEIKYDIKNKKGYILKAYGTINFDSLNSLKLDNKQIDKVKFNKKDKSIRNVISNSSTELEIGNINLKKMENESFFKRLSSQKFDLDLNKIQKWRFETDKIEIDNEKWFSKDLLLTNDPFNKPQVIIKNKNFQSISNEDEIIIKTKWSSLILDNRIKIPVGPRKITVGELQSVRWGLGYDQNNKDGLYISRNADPFYFNDKKIKLNVQNEFYLQRAFLGKTKSFTEKDKSIYSSKVEQDSKFSDLFGINAELISKIYGFGFSSELGLNSLDINKFNNILTSKNTLSKVLFEEEKKDFKKSTTLSFFKNYREKIWNGSLGEREILNATGTRIWKKNIWKHKDVHKYSILALGYGTYHSNKKSIPTQKIVRDRLNILLERNHSYPIWKPKTDIYINQDYIYSPKIIQKGIFLNMNGKVDLYRYNDENYQNLFTLRIGPEITLGNFKKKYFDYSKLSLYPKFTLAEGESPFDFDQTVDNHAIEISYKQQLFGALSFKIASDYNLDINSSKYKEFTNKVYGLEWKRRAYNLSLYYNQQIKTGGINFKIHNFNFGGYGNRFKKN